ncbi:MAG TPA: TlpA disulfide reductase family protein [Acidimicrobiales bacterium]|nr:TlpA disulfide reductase family protein [Acidimicrobiales bacterium]
MDQPRQRRIGHRIRWIVAAAGIVVAAMVFLLATAPPATVYDAQSPLIGRRAPAIAGPTLTAETFDLAAERGRYVIIDFFASWCVPCRQEQPQLVKFAKSPPDGAQLVGVVFNDSIAGARSLLGPWMGLYPVIPDTTGRLEVDYGVEAPPAKFVIDPSGRVVAKIIGPVTAAGLDSLILIDRKKFQDS